MEKRPLVSIDELLKAGDIESIREALNPLHPFEISDLILHKSENHQSILFGALSTSEALSTFQFLPAKTQKNLIKLIPSLQAAYILKELPPSNRTEFLENLPRETVDELVKLLPNEERILTLTLLGYPEGSIGRLMTPDYIAIKFDWTVRKVLFYIRTFDRKSELIDIILDHVDFLKIDIEGAEREVFSDTSSWIEKVDSIIIELHEHLKAGCNRSFFCGSNGFDNEWLQGENVYLSRNNSITRPTFGQPLKELSR